MKVKEIKTNDEILKERLLEFNSPRTGPRVGDYLYIPQTDDRIPEYTRFTHDWGDTIQTGGSEQGSYYLGGKNLSYSGGLDSGISTKNLIWPGKYKMGSVWFFDKGIAGAGRGVYFNVPMKVYELYPNTDNDLSGLWHIQCPYSLYVLDQVSHEKTCNYWYLIRSKGTSHTAFTTEQQLKQWLKENKLGLTKELTQPGTLSTQSLKYV